MSVSLPGQSVPVNINRKLLEGVICQILKIVRDLYIAGIPEKMIE